MEFFAIKFYFFNYEQDFYSCIIFLDNFSFYKSYIFFKKARKNIFKILIILISANKKFFSKN